MGYLPWFIFADMILLKMQEIVMCIQSYFLDILQVMLLHKI